MTKKYPSAKLQEIASQQSPYSAPISPVLHGDIRPTAETRRMACERFLRLPEVMTITGKSRSSIYEDMEIGSFPRHVVIGKRAIAWLESDIAEWMQERIQKSRHHDTTATLEFI